MRTKLTTPSMCIWSLYHSWNKHSNGLYASQRSWQGVVEHVQILNCAGISMGCKGPLCEEAVMSTKLKILPSLNSSFIVVEDRLFRLHDVLCILPCWLPLQDSWNQFINLKSNVQDWSHFAITFPASRLTCGGSTNSRNTSFDR